MRFEYLVNIYKEGDEFIAEFSDFPEAVTSGTSYEEAYDESKDALDEAIAGRINRSESIPLPNLGGQGERIAVSAQIAMKACLYLALLKEEWNNSQFAKKLKCDEKEVRRLIDPHHNTKLKTLEKALSALNTHIVIESCETINQKIFGSPNVKTMYK